MMRGTLGDVFLVSEEEKSVEVEMVNFEFYVIK